MPVVLPSNKVLVAAFCIVLFLLIAPQFFLKRLHSVDGGYSEWSQWSACLKDCGHSLQGRYRNCTNPKPSGFGADCAVLGSHIATKPCKLKECPVDGRFGPWTDWSECDKPCKDGKRKRTRKCDKPAPAFGGLICIGPIEELQPCVHLRPCPIDGGFSDWGLYSACSVTCGTGHKTRTRECNKPVPQFGGKNCVGNLQELVDCKEKDCAPKGNSTKT